MNSKFFWGASTSSHQVEGGNLNNWTVFEKENAKELSLKSTLKFSQLSQYRRLKKEIKNPQNYISGIGADHYHLYKDDIKLMEKLGLNAYRFSIEWSRLEPIEGEFDISEIKHYQQLIDELRKKGIEPIVTLWHFALPVWFEKKGGFAKLENIKIFARYCRTLAKSLRGVNYYLTINEPNIYASQSFLYGNWPPQVINLLIALNVYQNLKVAHKLAYKKIKEHNPKIKISIAHNVCYFEPDGNKFYNCLLSKIYSSYWNHDFIKSIRNELDFIGLNFHFHNKINWGRVKNDGKKLSDLGWELKPESLYDVLLDLKKYDLPIMVCENGLADDRDKYRSRFIKKSVEAVKKALKNQVQIFGYLHWSLLDNFEWDKGYWPKFGLIKINFKNKQRVIRKSAYLYLKLIRDYCDLSKKKNLLR